MSSISLPRILQTRKSSDDLEKEQYDKLLVNISVSINLPHYLMRSREFRTLPALSVRRRTHTNIKCHLHYYKFKTQIADVFVQTVDSQFSSDLVACCSAQTPWHNQSVAILGAIALKYDAECVIVATKSYDSNRFAYVVSHTLMTWQMYHSIGFADAICANNGHTFNFVCIALRPACVLFACRIAPNAWATDNEQALSTPLALAQSTHNVAPTAATEICRFHSEHEIESWGACTECVAGSVYFNRPPPTSWRNLFVNKWNNDSCKSSWVVLGVTMPVQRMLEYL